jgi:nucleotide-binding universal stress UspA family protein
MEEIKKILIATDGSEPTKPAVAQGLHLAKLLGAKVTALFVVDQIPLQNVPADSTVVFSVHALLESEGKKAVEEVKEAGDKIGVHVTPLVVEGSPAKKIIEIAADFDLVVMGTLGRSGLSKLLIGSVAERVARYAPCPVLIVRAKRRAGQ